MVKMGKRNKRISLHQKYKVAKKVRQHNKEVKKGLRGRKGAAKEKVQEVPGCVPFKAEILAAMAAAQLQEKAHHRKRLVLLSALSKKAIVDDREELKKSLLKDPSRGFVEDLRKIIEESNVIIQVLDARDPNGTRSLEVEKEVKANNKTLVFVLNKIDLVPADNLKAWVSHLSKESKVFPFKANGEIKSNIGERHISTLKKKRPAASYGTTELINYLKSLTLEKVVGKSIDKLVVGVIGLTNTGKSSLINSLKNKEVCEIGIVPGITRNIREIAYNQEIVLIDSPGIVLSKNNDLSECVLRNCVRVEQVETTLAVADLIFKRCTKNQLKTLYSLNDFNTYEEFIQHFAERCCPLKKGGIINTRLASMKLINDWNRGKIAYCTQTPLTDVTDCFTQEQDAAIRSLTAKAVWIETGITEMNGSGSMRTITNVDDLNALESEEVEESDEDIQECTDDDDEAMDE